MYEQASAKQKLSKNQVAKFEKTLMKGGQFDPKLQSKLNAVCTVLLCIGIDW